MRLFILTRHAHSTLNVAGRVNGDPNVPVPLTEQGREEARRLGSQLAELPLDLCVHTRFTRTRETADEILKVVRGQARAVGHEDALGERLGPVPGEDRMRHVPLLKESLLDDIDVGDLEGQTIADYRAWKREHRRSDPFPGGESLDDAAKRYARAFGRLLERAEQTLLVVCHEIPIRYALNAAAGSDDLDGPEHAIPNATPYLFDDESLARAAKRMHELSGE